MYLIKKVSLDQKCSYIHVIVYYFVSIYSFKEQGVDADCNIDFLQDVTGAAVGFKNKAYIIITILWDWNYTCNLILRYISSLTFMLFFYNRHAVALLAFFLQ